MAKLFQAAGGTRFVTALVQDYDWSTPVPPTAEDMKIVGEGLREVDAICAAHGLVQVLHPHVGTIVETAADVALALEHTDVAWCLDTGHLQIGGVDPVAFAKEYGQLDGSLFYRLSDTWQVGFQASNLLQDEVVTENQVNAGGLRVFRSSFVFDSRYTLVIRGTF